MNVSGSLRQFNPTAKAKGTHAADLVGEGQKYGCSNSTHTTNSEH